MTSRTRLYVGKLSSRTQRRDLEGAFGKYGRILSCDLKQGYGFVEFQDYRDAEDAVSRLNNSSLDGSRIQVEFSRGTKRASSSRGSTSRSDYRVVVENLPRDMSWQDLKDKFRTAGDVLYADVYSERSGKGKGVVEFRSRDDMKDAIHKLDGTEVKGNTITVREDDGQERSRSPRRRESSRRSRSPRRSPRRSSRRHSRSPPRRDRDRERDRERDRDRDRDRERDRERDRDRDRRDRDGDRDRDRDRDRNRDKESRRSRSPRKARSPRHRSRSRSKSPSKSPKRAASPSPSKPERGSASPANGDETPTKQRSPSKSPQQSPQRSPQQSPQRSPSRSPSRSPRGDASD